MVETQTNEFSTDLLLNVDIKIKIGTEQSGFCSVHLSSDLYIALFGEIF